VWKSHSGSALSDGEVLVLVIRTQHIETRSDSIAYIRKYKTIML
jgi:hypothetical protein